MEFKTQALHILILFNLSISNINSLKASGAEAFRLYDLNLLAFVLNKFDFWGPKCPNYENIKFQTLHNIGHNNYKCAR